MIQRNILCNALSNERNNDRWISSFTSRSERLSWDFYRSSFLHMTNCSIKNTENSHSVRQRSTAAKVLMKYVDNENHLVGHTQQQLINLLFIRMKAMEERKKWNSWRAIVLKNAMCVLISQTWKLTRFSVWFSNSCS